MWQVLGNIINSKNKSSSPNHNLLIDKNKISNQQDIAEEFNKYFCSIGSKLASKFNGEGDIKSFLGRGSLNTIQLYDISEAEVQNEINRLDINKSRGHDNLSAKFIQLVCSIILKSLSKTFDKCFKMGNILIYSKLQRLYQFTKKGKDLMLEIIFL